MLEGENKLVWSPIHKFLKEQIETKTQLRLLISPFIKIDALKSLVEMCEDISHLKVITRWAGSDILSHVADLDIYEYLTTKRIPLYLNPSIHLKLYSFDNACAFHSSGNITKRGLGLSSHSNIEIGCMVELSHEDWKQIYSILAKSNRVDDAMYHKALQYYEDNSEVTHNPPPLDLQPTNGNEFSILSLPASLHPEGLYSFYTAQHDNNEELISSYVHDLILYDIDDGLNRDLFFQQLKDNFRKHPFVRAIVNLIRKEHSARFGLVNAWIQNHCSDKPTPYKWEIKGNTRCLYSWLEYFFDEITWDRPQYSQVLRWKTK